MIRPDYADKDWLIPFWTLMLGRAGVNRRIRVEERNGAAGWGNFAYYALLTVISGYVAGYAVFGFMGGRL